MVQLNRAQQKIWIIIICVKIRYSCACMNAKHVWMLLCVFLKWYHTLFLLEWIQFTNKTAIVTHTKITLCFSFSQWLSIFDIGWVKKLFNLQCLFCLSYIILEWLEKLSLVELRYAEKKYWIRFFFSSFNRKGNLIGLDIKRFPFESMIIISSRSDSTESIILNNLDNSQSVEFSGW